MSLFSHGVNPQTNERYLTVQLQLLSCLLYNKTACFWLSAHYICYRALCILSSPSGWSGALSVMVGDRTLQIGSTESV